MVEIVDAEREWEIRRALTNPFEDSSSSAATSDDSEEEDSEEEDSEEVSEEAPGDEYDNKTFTALLNQRASLIEDHEEEQQYEDCGSEYDKEQFAALLAEPRTQGTNFGVQDGFEDYYDGCEDSEMAHVIPNAEGEEEEEKEEYAKLKEYYDQVVCEDSVMAQVIPNLEEEDEPTEYYDDHGCEDSELGTTKDAQEIADNEEGELLEYYGNEGFSALLGDADEVKKIKEQIEAMSVESPPQLVEDSLTSSEGADEDSDANTEIESDVKMIEGSLPGQESVHGEQSGEDIVISGDADEVKIEALKKQVDTLLGLKFDLEKKQRETEKQIEAMKKQMLVEVKCSEQNLKCMEDEMKEIKNAAAMNEIRFIEEIAALSSSITNLKAQHKAELLKKDFTIAQLKIARSDK